MSDETLGAPEAAPTETKQSVDDFIGSIIDAPDDTAAPEKAVATEAAPAEAEAAPETESADPETDPGATGDTTGTDEPKPSAIVPPQSMSAKDREAFHKLPPDQQKWLTDREQQMTADYTRKTMDLAKQQDGLKQLDQVLAPHRQKFAIAGVNEAQAVGQLLALSDYAARDFVGFVQEQARTRGIPLTAIMQPGQMADPQLLATQQRLQGLETVITQQQQAQEQQNIQAATSVIQAFAAEKGAEGTPAFPFYSDLETDMLGLMHGLMKSKPGLTPREYLARAYKMALADNEAVSAKADADRKAKADAEQVAKAKKAAAEAKKAAGPNVRTAGALPPSVAKSRNIDDFIGALVDERNVA